MLETTDFYFLTPPCLLIEPLGGLNIIKKSFNKNSKNKENLPAVIVATEMYFSVENLRLRISFDISRFVTNEPARNTM